jgi:NAD(P)-dependent dehydrogenase (short-subunit alcohol dehydrogenase family)
MNPPAQIRYALVTGGGSGLGRAFCLELAGRGWHVAVVDIDQRGAEETLELIRQERGLGQVELLDVADFGAWNSLIGKLRSQWPRLDLLVNDAGICGAGLVGEYDWTDFRRILDVNLMGVIHGCQICVPWLRDTAPGGHIVNIASLAAIINVPTMAAYNISKCGVLGLSETLYGELRELGIGVTVVLPGFFQSCLLQRGRFDDNHLREVAEEYTRNAEFTAEDVVAQTLLAMERRKLYVILGRRSRIAARLKRLAPSWFLRFAANTFARDLERAEKRS